MPDVRYTYLIKKIWCSACVPHVERASIFSPCFACQVTNRTCLRIMSSSLIARIRSSISHVSSHGRRERSNTCRCHKIYCLLTLFTAGLRQNAVFSLHSPPSPAFSLTHPARAGQQLEWTCDRTSGPPQDFPASLVFTGIRYAKSRYALPGLRG
jgi:hypothetical protein